jgi:hypothetical protein
VNLPRSSRPCCRRHGVGPPETTPAPLTPPSPSAGNQWMTSGSFPPAAPAPLAVSTPALRPPSAPPRPPLPRTEQNPSKVSSNWDELQQTEERVRGESLRGSCAGCSGKAGGGLKKASGAEICPSTGTGSAFLPKITASRKEFQRDSHHRNDLKREGAETNLSREDT